MGTAERVTVTMAAELVEGIARYESNRSRFITEAVEHEAQGGVRFHRRPARQNPDQGGHVEHIAGEDNGAAERRQQRRQHGEGCRFCGEPALA